MSMVQLYFAADSKDLVLRGEQYHVIHPSVDSFKLGQYLEFIHDNGVFALSKINFLIPVTILHYNRCVYYDIESDLMQLYADHFGDTEIWKGSGFCSQEQFDAFFLEKSTGLYVLLGWEFI